MGGFQRGALRLRRRRRPGAVRVPFAEQPERAPVLQVDFTEPLRHGRLPARFRVVGSGVPRVVEAGGHGNEAQFFLQERVGQVAVDPFRQPRVPAGEGADVHLLGHGEVVDRVVVPEEQPVPHPFTHLRHVVQGDARGHHLGPGPEAGHLRRQVAPDGFGEPRLELAEDPCQQRVGCIVRGTEPPLRVPVRGLLFQHRRDPQGLRLGQAAVEPLDVAGVRQVGRDVVEQYGKGPHAAVVETRGLVQQGAHRLCRREAQVLARMKAVDEVDAPAPGRIDEATQLPPLRFGIGQLPALAVVGIVLGRVEVGVHAARGAEREHRRAVRHAPRGTEEAFNDPPPLECRYGVGVLSAWRCH